MVVRVMLSGSSRRRTNTLREGEVAVSGIMYLRASTKSCLPVAFGSDAVLASV